jgi:hypothetical protein
MLVGADDGAVHDQVLEVGIIRRHGEDAVPHALLAPAAEAAEGVVPVAEGRRQVAPRRTSAHDPQHAFHEHSVVAAS